MQCVVSTYNEGDLGLASTTWNILAYSLPASITPAADCRLRYTLRAVLSIAQKPNPHWITIRVDGTPMGGTNGLAVLTQVDPEVFVLTGLTDVVEGGVEHTLVPSFKSSSFNSHLYLYAAGSGFDATFTVEETPFTT